MDEDLEKQIIQFQELMAQENLLGAKQNPPTYPASNTVLYLQFLQLRQLTYAVHDLSHALTFQLEMMWRNR